MVCRSLSLPFGSLSLSLFHRNPLLSSLSAVPRCAAPTEAGSLHHTRTPSIRIRKHLQIQLQCQAVRDKDTYVDDPVFGIVSVGTADVEPGSIAHGLDDADVIATIVKLRREKENKREKDQ